MLFFKSPKFELSLFELNISLITIFWSLLIREQSEPVRLFEQIHVPYDSLHVPKFEQFFVHFNWLSEPHRFSALQVSVSFGITSSVAINPSFSPRNLQKLINYFSIKFSKEKVS